MNPNVLSDRLLDFAARIGTAPGSHYEEACGAESRSDFVHKLRLALKELRESGYWLRLISRSELLSQAKLAKIMDECQQLCNIVGKSVSTASQNRKRT